MKNIRIKTMQAWFLVGVAALSFQNCSQSPLGKLGFETSVSEDGNSSFDSVDEFKTVPYALLSGEQILKACFR